MLPSGLPGVALSHSRAPHQIGRGERQAELIIIVVNILTDSEVNLRDEQATNITHSDKNWACQTEEVEWFKPRSRLHTSCAHSFCVIKNNCHHKSPLLCHREK